MSDSGFCDEGVDWLSQNLPDPFQGSDEATGKYTYALAIDNGKGEEVAQAIEAIIIEMEKSNNE